MSRLCAKPTCSDPAVRWFDILAAERRVVERTQTTPSAIPLCDLHAAKFSAPAGWTIDSDLRTDWNHGADQNDSADQTNISQPPSVAAAPVPESGRDSGSRLASALKEAVEDRPRRRKHDRDAPWFLAGSAADPSASEAPAAVPAPLLPAGADVEDTTSNEMVPSAGSLLHRAFHGPDRDTDVARAKSADRDSTSAGSDVVESSSPVANIGDLTTRRAKQTESEGYDIELPFPPFEPARHVAVS